MAIAKILLPTVLGFPLVPLISYFRFLISDFLLKIDELYQKAEIWPRINQYQLPYWEKMIPTEISKPV